MSNSNTRKSRFKSDEVRRVFRRRYQHEYILPSGKPSGIYAYTIADEEIDELTAEFEAPTFVLTDDPSVLFGGYFKTESEWRLWTALRLKYGVNYLNPRRRQFWLPDYMYEEPKPEKKELVDPIGEFGAWVSDLEYRVKNTEDSITALAEAQVNQASQKKMKKKSKKFDFDLTSLETTL